jgi:choline-sulfatase
MRILYVDIDSLRPDHLGCYGYGRPTSPVIDEVAAGGVRFSGYHATDSPCVPSRAALMSVRPGIMSGVVAHENTLEGSTMRYGKQEQNGGSPMFMHHLAAAGYETVSFSSFANRHLMGWFHFGFRQFNLSSLKNGNENADEVNARALPWFREHASEDDWFVHLNYWDPHTMYTEPPGYAEEMFRHPAPEWPDERTIREQQSLTGVRTPRTLWTPGESPDGYRSPVPTMPDAITSRRDFEHLMNGYDGAIRYADEHLGHVLEELDRQGVLDETAILISADHGEAFGELGQYMEHGSASPAVNRVPLIARWPGLTDGAAGVERSELLYNLDLAPTVSEALGLDVPSGWQGRSFLPLLGGGELEEPRAEIYLSHGLHTRQRAVHGGRFLYVRTYHPGLYLYPPRMLFDLHEDPHQTNDLAGEMPERVREMDVALTEWERRCVERTGLPDAMRVIQEQAPSMLGTLDGYLERLRADGREDDAEHLLAQAGRIEEEYAPEPL